jgi:hypothetical protein
MQLQMQYQLQSLQVRLMERWADVEMMNMRERMRMKWREVDRWQSQSLVLSLMREEVKVSSMMDEILK